MPDLEKVIQAFENCTAPEMNDDDETYVDCIRAGECPWDDCQERNRKLIDIPLSLAMAALELLKAQEPGWISVKDRLPEEDRAVLAVKQLKDGRRDMCLARCIPEYEQYDVRTGGTFKAPYWICGGNNNIIYWMPLPDMPKEESA